VFHEKISVVRSRGFHCWCFSSCVLPFGNACAGETMQCRAAATRALVLVLPAYRRPKMLVRRQADAVEIIVAVAAGSNGTSRSRPRTERPSGELLQSPGCTGVDSGRSRRFRSALARALSRSNGKIIADAAKTTNQPRLSIPKKPARLSWRTSYAVTNSRGALGAIRDCREDTELRLTKAEARQREPAAFPFLSAARLCSINTGLR
jgi:hypothetical protein